MANISDVELRNRLIERGFNPPPVTDTSRALLVKKLKKLEASQKVPSANNVAVKNVDQYDGGKARKARKTERKRDSSPELLPDTFPGVPESSPSPPRLTRSARKEVVTADPNDSLVNKIKNSTPYPDANYVKGGGAAGGGGGSGDPFERGSDSDDSLYASRANNSRYLVRKPIGVRRESTEYFSAPTAYRKYDALNGASPYSPSKGVSRSRYIRASSKQFFSNVSWKVVTPTMVLVSCLVFFVIVGGIYYTKNDRSYNELLAVDVVEQPKCSARPRPGVPCVPDADIPATIDHMKVLYRALYKRKLKAVCYGASDANAARMSRDEVAELLLVEAGLLHFECEKTIDNMKVLVAANPSLKIAWSETAGFFELEDPVLPWSCTLRVWSRWMWDYVLYVMLTAAFVFSMHILLRWVTMRQQQQTKEKQELVKGILEVLQHNAAANPSQSYLPIVHVRDQLIAFADRNRKRGMWLEAVRYVEENESRVRKEVQPFEGEDYDVWRWVGGYQKMNTLKPKTWQGEAFETSKDTMNTPLTSPTPCLKIRHMFDPKNEAADEDWSTGVKDAILERCEGVHIVHMVVDESSAEGCVYIKCASADDAGKAYRKIHGAWFDGKIVTVKYLRLERYHERFPASVGLTKPLIPSNDQKRSLA